MMKPVVIFAALTMMLHIDVLHAAVPEPAIVPQPRSVVLNDTAAPALKNGSAVVYAHQDAAMKRTAEIFAATIEKEAGLKLKATSKPQAGAIVLLINDKLPAEGYRIENSASGIRVEGGSEAGIFYGLQTLRQLINQYGASLPALMIEDQPWFAYRGAMLDCGRHFFSVEEVKTYIDIIAMHKLNRFHWHLTEDQGWRIEIKRYPELTKIGSVRSETVIGQNTGKYDGTPYGGYYTQKQIREVVAYAAERFITVIPEIEMPGHSSAALTAYPWLGCVGKGYKVQTDWDVFRDVYCAGKESTFEFMENVLSEVLELFPSKFIHIGGDECPKESWKACPSCQKRMRDLGLKDEMELQSYFVHRMEKWLNAHDRNLIGWDEILEGGISKTATVMSWRGAKGGIEAAKSGNMVVMTPNTHCYLDYYQTADPKQLEPQGIGGNLPMSQVYALDPYDQLSEAERKCILGVQGNLWTEYIPTFTHAEHMALPRLAALSEVGWAYDRRDLNDFTQRMNAFKVLYDKNKYNYATYFFEGTDLPKK